MDGGDEWRKSRRHGSRVGNWAFGTHLSLVLAPSLSSCVSLGDFFIFPRGKMGINACLVAPLWVTYVRPLSPCVCIQQTLMIATEEGGCPCCHPSLLLLLRILAFGRRDPQSCLYSLKCLGKEDEAPFIEIRNTEAGADSRKERWAQFWTSDWKVVLFRIHRALEGDGAGAQAQRVN